MIFRTLTTAVRLVPGLHFYAPEMKEDLRAEPLRPGDLLIASSDYALRTRLVQTLGREADLRSIREAPDRATAERFLAALVPAVLLLDLSSKGFDGLQSLKTIRSLSPTTRTIVLADADGDLAAVRALKDGAHGYCSRNTDPGLILKAIRLVRQGEIWVGRKVMLELIDELTALHAARAVEDETRLRRLTQRERQISGLIAIGASNKEIADRLSITERTVKAHLTNIFQKLQLSSRVHLAIHALQLNSPTKTKVQ